MGNFFSVCSIRKSSSQTPTSKSAKSVSESIPIRHQTYEEINDVPVELTI